MSYIKDYLDNISDPKEKAIKIKNLRLLVASMDNCSWHISPKLMISIKQSFKNFDIYLQKEQFKLAKKL